MRVEHIVGQVPRDGCYSLSEGSCRAAGLMAELWVWRNAARRGCQVRNVALIT